MAVILHLLKKVVETLQSNNKYSRPPSQSPKTTFQQQIAAPFESNAGLQETLEGVALPVEAIDDVETYETGRLR
jgi:hypothetical protein